MRSALIWLGRADPCDTMEVARTEDPERAALAELLTAWADKAGETTGSQKRFADMLRARGYAPKRTENARRFEGIRLRRRDYSDDPRYGE